MKIIQYIVIIFSICTFFIYNQRILLFFKGLVSIRKYASFLTVSAIIINMLVALAIRFFIPWIWVSVCITWFVAFIEFKLIFKMNFSLLLYASGLFVFYILVFRSMVTALFSLFLKKNIHWLFRNNAYYVWIFFLGTLAALVYLYVYRKIIMPDEKTKQLLQNKGQMIFVATCQNALIIFILVTLYSYPFDLYRMGFPFANLIACIAAVCIMAFIKYNTTKTIQLTDYKMNTRLLEDQLSRQIRHYKSYQKYTESFRAFRHDYKSMMASVKALLKNQENQKAITLIDEIHHIMQKDVLIHKNYSNNVLLDAILQDTANLCEEHTIRFSAVVYLPGQPPLSDIDICRVFSNLANNALEACLNVPEDTDRMIEITSSANSDWLTIEVVNTFNGLIRIKDGNFETTKSNKEFHGIGLKVVKEIIEKLGGFVQIEPDTAKKIFSVKLHIPSHTSSDV